MLVFRSFGTPPRKRARCPWCGCLERHRFLALVLQRTGVFLPGLGRVLEVGPFPPVTRLLREHGGEVTTLDLYDPAAEIQANLEDLPLPDASFDSVLCMHVLEHVTDDLAALRELRRVIRPGGYVILQVPVQAGTITVEDPSVTDPEERLTRFGQHDHVRVYGDDFADRLTAAGFNVQAVRLTEIASARMIRPLALSDGMDVLYLARVPVLDSRASRTSEGLRTTA